MKLTIRATANMVTLDGVRCRVWEGVTAGGVPCKVFVHRLAVAKDEDTAQFDRELSEQLPPGQAVPLRMVL